MIALNEFINKYLSVTVGYPTDNDYPGECLPIVKRYIKECFDIDPPPSGTNSAYGYWSNFPDPLSTKFIKVPIVESDPQRGDIPIWAPTSNNKSGHIDIFLSKTGDTSFMGFDQNWGGKKAHLQQHDYAGLVGFLRPKSIIADMGRIASPQDWLSRNGVDAYKDTNGNPIEVQAAISMLESATKSIVEKNKEIESLKEQITELQGQTEPTVDLELQTKVERLRNAYHELSNAADDLDI